MRQRLKHYVQSPEGGKWTVCNGFIDIGAGRHVEASRTLKLRLA